MPTPALLRSPGPLTVPVVSVNLVLVAACALVDADGRVLIARRPAAKTMAGLWEFPGGKIEAGERPEDSLSRELKEELDIVVQEACLAPLAFASAGSGVAGFGSTRPENSRPDSPASERSCSASHSR